ncbi:MAG: hypothetical protein K8R74_17920, partial [Bacteroidales bacterium]|nr:hypothetical protein [Bacteroidales bacterium]
MKTNNKTNRMILLAALFIWSFSGMGQKSANEAEITYYSVDIGGVICGYLETSSMLMNESEKEWIQVNDEIIMKLTVLGEDIDISIHNEYKIDPVTENYFYCNRNYNNRAIEMISTTEVKEDIAYFTSNQEVETKEFDLSEGVILESTFTFNHLVEDFIIGSEKEKTY